MKIREIQIHRLLGGTVDGGWPEGHQPEDDLHTLVEVIADDGRTGVGSVFTNSALVAAGVETLRPLWQGESAIEPERVSEKLRQSSFWQGRGGTLEHVISGIDIALWDLFGKACGQPVARLLGGYYRQRIRPYASLLFDEPDVLAERVRSVAARGFRAIKLGWRPFGRRSHQFDERLVRTAREALGPDIDLLVDAGGSEQFWPHASRARHASRGTSIWRRCPAASVASNAQPRGPNWNHAPLPTRTTGPASSSPAIRISQT